MKTIIKRLKANTPPFFVNIRRVCLSLSAVSTVAMQFEEKLPQFVSYAIPYMLTAGLVGTFLAQLTVNNPDQDLK